MFVRGNYSVQGCLLMLLCVWLASCGVVRNTPKYNFNDGLYRSTVFGRDKKFVYVENREDTVQASPVNRIAAHPVVVPGTVARFTPDQPLNDATTYHFNRSSFDIDFLTIPFKYRPVTAGLPRQFNTNLNGAIYTGFRHDRYSLFYRKNPLNRYARRINHYGFSLGGFTGLGATAINPWVTQNAVSVEYDGVVWSKGMAGIIAIDTFTLGLALGWDSLLDPNRTVWIYDQKPWIGLAFGLNIN